MLALDFLTEKLREEEKKAKSVHTAKNQFRIFETNIPGKGNARPQSQFPHSRVCERFILYIPSIELPIPILLHVICGPILGIYKSLTDT